MVRTAQSGIACGRGVDRGEIGSNGSETAVAVLLVCVALPVLCVNAWILVREHCDFVLDYGVRPSDVAGNFHSRVARARDTRSQKKIAIDDIRQAKKCSGQQDIQNRIVTWPKSCMVELMSMNHADIAVVVIGRNEGERLYRCLESIPASVAVTYVDSDSRDGSAELAERLGRNVIRLSPTAPMSAARARNAGYFFFGDQSPPPAFVQMVDGDCEVDADWLRTGQAELIAKPELAVVFGRTREKYPKASIYNAFCDDEWNVPVGNVNSCGGNAMFRMAALTEVGGYNETLIAGEEPDLCLRLRQKGWVIQRVDAEMTLHDAAIHSFGQWWKRTQRSGFAYAEHLARHGRQSDPDWIRENIRIIFYGVSIPLVILFCGFLSLAIGPYPLFAAVLLTISLFTVKFLSIRRRKMKNGFSANYAQNYAFYILLAKFPQAQGMLKYIGRQFGRKQNALIEYK